MLASVDHIVLTTRDLERCVDFYTRVLGCTHETYGAGRIAPHASRRHVGPVIWPMPTATFGALAT